MCGVAELWGILATEDAPALADGASTGAVPERPGTGHRGEVVTMRYILASVSVSVLIAGAVIIAEKKIGDIIGKIVDRIFREE